VLFSEPKIPQCTVSLSRARMARVSVLFSEPKIPQSMSLGCERERKRVSVLFSEPKIPQSGRVRGWLLLYDGFSALQRAENSSIQHGRGQIADASGVSVLFSEPKIPQSA